MKDKAKKQASPHGWGAGEILRTMREDQQRFRRPQKGFSKGDSMPAKKDETTKGQGGQGP